MEHLEAAPQRLDLDEEAAPMEHLEAAPQRLDLDEEAAPMEHLEAAPDQSPHRTYAGVPDRLEHPHGVLLKLRQRSKTDGAVDDVVEGLKRPEQRPDCRCLAAC
jgi:hypothetical protein